MAEAVSIPSPLQAWTYANTWESIARALPDSAAIVQGETSVTWRAFDAAADALASDLLAAGLGHQAKVAVYMANRPEYLVAYFAAFKAGLAPFNVNYRYGAEEVAYLLDNADAEAVIFEADYAPVLAAVRGRVPGVKRWMAITQPGVAAPQWALAFEDIVAQPAADVPVIAPWGRAGEDLFLLYTGGTTGMPKGVMWRQGDLLARGGYGANPAAGLGPWSGPAEAGPRAAAQASRTRSLIPCPLMHGTGLIAALSALNAGGTVILPQAGRFDAERLWDAAAREGATRITIAGQSFALPMVEALQAHPKRWDLTRLVAITSSGAMWGAETKRRLLAHLPWAQMIDSYSSSEAMGVGQSITTASGAVETARFTIGPDCAVFTEDGRRVAPSSGERGLIALAGYGPVGYYKDSEKSARTFPVMEGRRWSIPGDWALVEADGAIRLLGRGSQCINTGGEKVFPEEVEEVLKIHPAVRDAAVVGVADPRFGERIVALVELGANGATEDALRDHVRARLAGYKVPRRLLVLPTLGRGPNGKLDYAALKVLAAAVEA
jgi:acyl-CoA synthetase (AMP-forming)/AMP-acid ligase II